MKQQTWCFQAMGFLVVNVVFLFSCASMDMKMPVVTKNTESKDTSMSSDSCQKARDTEDELIRKYGNPDFSCTSSYIKGVMVKMWCCIGGKRIVYYSFGHERGCFDSGYESYPCGGNELPASVKSEITYAGEGNECWILLDKERNPCRK
jgi:hypothetical protein